MTRLGLAVIVLLGATLRGLAADPVLSVISSERTLTLTAEELRQLPHTELTATEPHSKKEHRYSGVPVRDLLARVGAPLGEKLRGKALQLAVLVRSGDGYATLFALAEFDESFSSRTILLADAEDGGPLPASAAPLCLVVPGDRRAARWARMVRSVEIVAPGTAP